MSGLQIWRSIYPFRSSRQGLHLGALKLMIWPHLNAVLRHSLSHWWNHVQNIQNDLHVLHNNYTCQTCKIIWVNIELVILTYILLALDHANFECQQPHWIVYLQRCYLDLAQVWTRADVHARWSLVSEARLFDTWKLWSWCTDVLHSQQSAPLAPVNAVYIDCLVQ